MSRKGNFGNQIFSSKILLIISLITLIFFSTNLVKEIINRRDLKKDVRSLEEEINRLESRNNELSQLIGYFESLDFVEKEARTKLNLRKPGEKIIIVGDEESEANTVQPIEQDISNYITNEIVSLSNPERWWNYFFKVN